MPSVLLAWELGEGLGHVARLAMVGARLQSHGYQTRFALRDLSSANAWPLGGGQLWQAPWRQPQHLVTARPSVSLAGVLARLGLAEPSSLQPLIDAWLNLFAASGADVLVADFAPTALLAARIASLPALALGNGYEVPPDGDPLPPLYAWQADDRAARGAESARLLTAWNTVLLARGAAPLTHPAQLFADAAPAICAFAETDHYPDRRDGHLGPVFADGIAVDADWLAAPEPRVIAYLGAADRGVAALRTALDRLRLPVLLHQRGGPVGDTGPTIRKLAAPAQLAVCAPAARLIVCAGGMGTVSQALLAGTPLLLMPQHAEQSMLAWRLSQAGAAAIVPHDATADWLLTALRGAVADKGLATAARSLAERRRGYDPAATSDGIARRVIALAGHSGFGASAFGTKV